MEFYSILFVIMLRFLKINLSQRRQYNSNRNETLRKLFIVELTEPEGSRFDQFSDFFSRRREDDVEFNGRVIELSAADRRRSRSTVRIAS